jgi:hypothetical protein
LLNTSAPEVYASLINIGSRKQKCLRIPIRVWSKIHMHRGCRFACLFTCFIVCFKWKCSPIDIQSGVQPNKDAEATSSEHTNRRDTRVGGVTYSKLVRGRLWRASTTISKYVFVLIIYVSIKRSFLSRRRPRKFTFFARASRGFNEVVNSTLGPVREKMESLPSNR